VAVFCRRLGRSMTRSSHRPTLAPAFDVAEYARESDRFSQESAGENATESPDCAPSTVRLITRPQWGQVITNDAWARMVVGAPRVTMSAAALKRLPLDHRAGFVLSLMDGSLDLETLLELSGMDRDEVLDLVRNLFDSGVVEFQ
jgi:hypothetical protein